MSIELIVISVLGGLISLLLAWGILVVFIEQKKLKSVNENLLVQVNSMANDISIVCATAVNVDMRLSQQSSQVENVVKDVSSHKREEDEQKRPYNTAIKRVQSGASQLELIKECGLSREEAALLIKLHG